jgi:hypothetical protein
MKKLVDLETTLMGGVCIMNPMIADLKELQQSLFPGVGLSDSFTWATAEMQLVPVLRDLSIVQEASVPI